MAFRASSFWTAALALSAALAPNVFSACDTFPSCESSGCPAGQSCGSDGLCRARTCDADQDCDGGTVCGLTGRCASACTAPADCGSGETCDASGACAMACLSERDCAVEGDVCDPSGACTKPCGGCPSGAVCTSVSLSPEEPPYASSTEYCAVRCAGGPACPSGHACLRGMCFPYYCAVSKDPEVPYSTATVWCVATAECASDTDCGAHAKCGPSRGGKACGCEIGYENPTQDWQFGCVPCDPMHGCGVDDGGIKLCPMASECQCSTSYDCQPGQVCQAGHCL